MSVPFARVRVPLDEPALGGPEGVAAATAATLASCGVVLRPGSRVAIAVGSRGIADLVTVVRQLAAWARAQGAEPFLVPAMGSHGGATAEGQRAVIASSGLTAATGLAVEAGTGVVELPRGGCPVPVHTSAAAAAAEATVLVNRVKPHTDFHGRWESGLAKMAAIGLGQQVQAEALHAHGVRGLRDLMPQVAAQVLAHGNIALGVAIVENAADRTMHIEAVPAGRILDREPELLELARRHMPRLPVDRLDVLLVDRMGKDISGVGMDTNVIGRRLIAGEPEPDSPRITMIACHALTPASHGNATGVGLADVITASLAGAIDHPVTTTNIVTSGFLLRGKLPLVAPDAATAWAWCLRGATIVDPSTVRAARIVDTLHPHELWVSDAVLGELRAEVEILGEGLALHDAHGALRPFDG